MNRKSDIVVSNISSRQLVVELAEGNILDVEAQAYAIGLYEGVMPGGAAKAIDGVLGDEILSAFGRGMFSARLGEVYFLPCSRSGLSCDFIILVGLGNVNNMLSPDSPTGSGYEKQEKALQTVGANLVRAMISSNIGHVATVLMGSSTGLNSNKVVQNLTRGIVHTMMLEDSKEVVGKVTICEFNANKYAKMATDVKTLLTDEIPKGLNVRLALTKLTANPTRKTLVSSSSDPNPNYLFTSGEVLDEEDEGLLVKSVFMGASTGAAVFERKKFVDKASITNIVNKLTDHVKSVDEAGRDIATLVLPKEISKALAKNENLSAPLIVVNDLTTSFIPWEIVKIGQTIPSLRAGMSRVLQTAPNVDEAISTTKHQSSKVRVLIITDPTNDLRGAREEAEILKGILSKMSDVFEYYEIGNTLDYPSNTAATKREIVSKVTSGQFHIVHYSGHAFFDPINRSASGLIAHNKEIVSSEEFKGVSELPQIFFFNACESGRVRKTRDGQVKIKKIQKPKREFEIARNVSVAEGLVSSGVSHFIGTYWPVGDDAAKIFSQVFYTTMMEGETIGESIRKARKALRDKKNFDWADYIHYGNPNFRLTSKP